MLDTPPEVWRHLSSFDDRKAHTFKYDQEFITQTEYENCVVTESRSHLFSGYCVACKDLTEFSYHVMDDGSVNWRESLNCKNCGLNSRARATIEVLRQLGAQKSSRIYTTEQVTPMFQFLQIEFPSIIGSEFLSVQHCKGIVTETPAGLIRHEDLTELTFGNENFDYILCLDVLEHVPDYLSALAECYRCLAPNGSLVFTLPFRFNDQETVVRAQVTESGEIRHLKSPEYHGDPMSGDGVLCFCEFGWQLLDELRHIGFSKVQAVNYWSTEKGYLGFGNLVFVANKGIRHKINSLQYWYNLFARTGLVK